MIGNAITTHTVSQKASRQLICPGEGHILPVTIQVQSPGGLWMHVINELVLCGGSLRENRHVQPTCFLIARL